jgi:hypothetical protein
MDDVFFFMLSGSKAVVCDTKPIGKVGQNVDRIGRDSPVDDQSRDNTPCVYARVAGGELLLSRQ